MKDYLANKFNQLDKGDKFLKRYNHYSLKRKIIVNGPISITEIKFIVRNLKTNKSSINYQQNQKI